ncbi:hypothetical protein V496_02087 [Pseudogymnoascus sp. VKM F-4515 (FW-2607)]|nr:hypothetical protein V496_02087 [Pseudogymnoascus sp. VKM F-4515 (FW-2607)]
MAHNLKEQQSAGHHPVIPAVDHTPQFSAARCYHARDVTTQDRVRDDVWQAPGRLCATAAVGNRQQNYGLASSRSSTTLHIDSELSDNGCHLARQVRHRGLCLYWHVMVSRAASRARSNHVRLGLDLTIRLDGSCLYCRVRGMMMYSEILNYHNVEDAGGEREKMDGRYRPTGLI